MAYNAIIHGVKGILYWGTYSMPQPSQRWTDLKMVSRELANIMPVLAAPDFPCILSLDYEEMGYSIDKGVEYIVKEYDGAKYIISANTTIGPVNVTFSGIPFPADSPVWEDTAEVMFEDRAIAISNGSFVDSFEPYGVHVYRIMGD